MKKIYILISAVITVFTFFGCDGKTMGIFYSIEQERKVEDNTIENYASIGNMVILDDTYYAASGNLYMVDAGDNFTYHGGSSSAGSWIEDPDFPSNEKLCFSIGISGSAGSEKLYGVFFDKSASNYSTSLYVKDSSSGSWDQVTETSDLNVEKIIGTEDTLFILSYTTDSSNIRSYSISTFDGSSSPNVIGSALPPSAIFDAAEDNSSSFRIIYGTKLYSIPSGSLSSGSLSVDSTVPFDGENLKGIHYSSIYTGLFVSLEDGSVYYLADGGEWTELEDELNHEPGDFIDFIMTDGTGTERELLLAGTSNGYYELEKSSSMTGTEITGSFLLPVYTAKTSSYQTLDLYYAVVHSFFSYTIDQGESTEQRILFALTHNNGLWSNAFYETDDNRVWDIE